MIAKQHSALMILAPCALLVLAMESAQGAATFPNFIPFDGILGTEGVAVDKVGNVYVSVNMPGGSDQIWKCTPSGEGSALVDLGAPGYACGLAVDGMHPVAAISSRTSFTFTICGGSSSNETA